MYDSGFSRLSRWMGGGGFVLALSLLPAAAELNTASQPLTAQTNRAEWEGTVTFASQQDEGFDLELTHGEQHLRVLVLDGAGLSSTWLWNSRIRVAGACRTAYNSDGQPVPSVLVAANRKDLQLLEVAPRLWEAYPLVDICELNRTNSPGSAAPLVHVAGQFRATVPGESLIVEDSTGSIAVTGLDRSPGAWGGPVELLGQTQPLGSNLVLQCVVCREGDAQPAGFPVLTTVEQVKRLRRNEAAEARPVRVRGIITCLRPDFHSVVLQDSTCGIYIDLFSLEGNARPRRGEYWVIEGVTDPGDFAPLVRARRATCLGEGRLPDPLHPTWDQLMNGSLDTQYVELQGIVTDRLPEGMALLTRGGRINVRLPGLPLATVNHCEGTLVRLRGCLFADWNPQTHQVKVGEVLVYDASLSADELAPVNPFAGPVKSVAELRLFDPQASVFRRAKVCGQIIHRQPEEYFLSDGTNGLRFRAKPAGGLLVGDLVEVAGFPELGGASLIIQEAAVRKTGHAPLPEARKLLPDELLAEARDSTLVRVEALVVSLRNERDEQVLELQAGLRTFLARLNHPSDWVGALPPGSRVEVTGVYATRGGHRTLGQSVSSFELLLERAAGIRVLARPPWWTLRRVLVLLAVMAAVLLAGLLWVITLRRRVNVQTEIIRHKAQREATLEERARLAREFHDTLEQALAGLGLQLNALGDRLGGAPAELRRILGVARAMVRHSQEEARRSVHNLRTLALDQGDLVAGLNQLANRARDGWTGRIEVQISGTPRRLPVRVESHLLRLCQEGTNNAMKHAAPAVIRLDLGFTPEHVRLAIVDDGCGFDAQHATASAAGHFGLLGMRERAEKIGGTLSILSAPGAGTAVRLTLPLNGLLDSRHEREDPYSGG